jgi:hypothetical protein
VAVAVDEKVTDFRHEVVAKQLPLTIGAAALVTVPAEDPKVRTWKIAEAAALST